MPTRILLTRTRIVRTRPKIIQQARNLLSLATDGELRQGVASVMELFRGGDESARFSQLKKLFVVPGSSLLSALGTARSTLTRKAGNTNSGAGKAANMAKVGENNDDMARLVEEHPPANDGGPGEPFWVRDPNGLGTDTYRFQPGNYPVFTALNFNGIRTRLRAPSSNNGRTHSRKVPATNILILVERFIEVKRGTS